MEETVSVLDIRSKKLVVVFRFTCSVPDDADDNEGVEQQDDGILIDDGVSLPFNVKDATVSILANL